MEIAANDHRKSFTISPCFPAPGSEEEKVAFQKIQEQFSEQFEKVFPDKLAPRTVVILPSLSLDQEILSKIKGAVHYEERMLCLLMLLRMPLTKIIYITSVPVTESIVDYYLHLLPGITGHHARKRLTMLSCYDASVLPLTQKILNRPRLLERIKSLIPKDNSAHLTCYNITPLEKTLAVQLGIPMFGTDPALFYEGTKSGARKIFENSGVCHPAGFEDLHSKAEVITALTTLKTNNPQLRKAVLKMNDGFSGDGNAIYTYPEIHAHQSIRKTIEDHFSAYVKPVSHDVTEKLFFEKFNDMGGIVEEFLEGRVKMSPSVQCIINPNREIDIVSTHDQLLGGDDGQIFLGAIFPANEKYNVSLAAEGKKIAAALVQKGALGRFAIDFISIEETDGNWKHYAIEINLRKGGTTHPYLMLKFLTDGTYNEDKGEYLTASGNKRFYFASDNVTSDRYKGLTPDDLIDIAMFHNLMYDGATQEGVMFHMLGAVSEHGKMGLVCVGSTPERARCFYDKTIEILNLECCPQ